MKLFGYLFFSILSSISAAQPEWKVTEISRGGMSQANRIGNGGTCIGFGVAAQNDRVWDSIHGPSEIPAIAGTAGSVDGQEVNSAGTVVGWQGTELGGGLSRKEAFVWDRDMGTRRLFDFQQGQAEAYGISDSGIVGGRAWSGGTFAPVQPWLWTKADGVLWLPLVAGTISGEVRMVNSFGMAAGYSGGVGHPAVWGPDGSVTAMSSPVGHGQTDPQDLNDNGFITGMSNGATRSEGFLRDPSGNYTFIENPFNPNYYTWGISLNINNEVVGRFGMGGNNKYGGFYWTAESGTLNLTDHLASGYQNWRIGSAQSINDKGQIVGWGYDSGRLTAVLLEPVVVPEPCSLLVLGGACLLIRRKKLTASEPQKPSV